MSISVRNYLILIFVFISTNIFAQFGHSEFYAVSKFGFGMGMNSYTYNSSLDGTSSDIPKSIQIELGTGSIPEIGVGLKLMESVYVEVAVSYSHTQDFYAIQSSNETKEQGYSFHRYAILIGGKYYVPVNENFVMDFNAGFSYSLPQELVVKMSGYTESIKYAGTNGLQFGFAANYRVGAVSFSGGLRYRFEGFSIKPHQQLPDDFETLNPSFQKISSTGIDIIFGAQYNF